MKVITALAGLIFPIVAQAAMPQMTPDQFMASITPGINQLCGDANKFMAVVQDAAAIAAKPQVAGLLPYVVASCASPDAIAALIAKSDNNTPSWLYQINTMMIADLLDGLAGH